MSKAIIYSDENVLAAQQALRSKTARNVGKTRSQVAEFLADDIRRAIEQGYRLKDIKNILAKAGSSISIAKMQSVLEKRNQAEISSAIHSAIETEKTEIFVSKLHHIFRVCTDTTGCKTFRKRDKIFTRQNLKAYHFYFPLNKASYKVG